MTKTAAHTVTGPLGTATVAKSDFGWVAVHNDHTGADKRDAYSDTCRTRREALSVAHVMAFGSVAA
jgi:hypothetical protein